MNRKLVSIVFVIIIWSVYSCGNKQAVSEPGPFTQPAEQEPTRAEQVTKAIAEAYPQIEKAEFRDGDWAVLLHDTWYYYAESRLLPENLREEAANYRPIQFYRYPAELPPWAERPPEETERLSNLRNNNRRSTLLRSSFFMDALWQAHDRNESYSNLRTVNFLGKSTRVHRLIQEPLSLVEERIQTIARTDPQIQTWINSIHYLESWNWRNIAESQSRSYHSYGVAIDILPRSLAGKQTYWLWSADWREDWWNVPYNERYHPPAAVVSAFEVHGFVWGGKWFLYDTMHFEYRPEVMILNGLPLETRR
jgi:hypothetical protein